MEITDTQTIHRGEEMFIQYDGDQSRTPGHYFSAYGYVTPNHSHRVAFVFLEDIVAHAKAREESGFRDALIELSDHDALRGHDDHGRLGGVISSSHAYAFVRKVIVLSTLTRREFRRVCGFHPQRPWRELLKRFPSPNALQEGRLLLQRACNTTLHLFEEREPSAIPHYKLPSAQVGALASVQRRHKMELGVLRRCVQGGVDVLDNR